MTILHSADVHVVLLEDKALLDWACICSGDSELDAESSADMKILHKTLQWWCWEILEKYSSTQLGRWSSVKIVVEEVIQLLEWKCNHVNCIETEESY